MVQICQYEFLVEDMFTNKLRDEIVKLLKISPDDLMKKNSMMGNALFFIRRMKTIIYYFQRMYLP